MTFGKSQIIGLQSTTDIFPQFANKEPIGPENSLVLLYGHQNVQTNYAEKVHLHVGGKPTTQVDG